LSLPKNLNLAPNEGFMSLLPGETRSLNVTYTPPATTELDCSLTVTKLSPKEIDVKQHFRSFLEA
jgi:hypothetical protein